VVVAGHSAGGQFVTRYEMANKIHGTLGVAISYVVANPSTYAWPSPLRPLRVGAADSATAEHEALGRSGEKPSSDFTFGPFDASKLPSYDRWPAGLEQRSGYTAHLSDAQLKKQLAERPTTYLLSQVDVLPLGGFDSSPSAMTQGPTRRARARRSSSSSAIRSEQSRPRSSCPSAGTTTGASSRPTSCSRRYSRRVGRHHHARRRRLESRR